MSALSSKTRRQGGRLFLAVAGWMLMVILGAVGIWFGFFSPLSEPATVPPTATPTPTPGLIPLVADTPVPQATSASPSTSLPQPTVPPEEEVFGYGIAVHGVVSDPNYAMEQVKNLGFGWVKQQVNWADLEPSPGEVNWGPLDGVVDAASLRGLRVMLSVVDAPRWTRTYFDDLVEGAPPDDLTLFADFLGRLVDRYRGRIQAIEVWNEQNLDREWDTAAGVSSQRYVEMLRMAYQVIKSRDPHIIVISGALSPVGATASDPANPSRVIYMDDFQYLQEMVSLNFLSYCDCVGVHHNGYNIPPDVTWDDTSYQDNTAVFRGFWDNPHPSWSFRSTLWRYRDAVSGMKPLCVTEFGWASSEGLGGYPRGFEFAQDNTLQEQAEYLVQAFGLMRDWGFVRLAFLWNLDYAQKDGLGPTDPNAPYSLLDFQGIARPAFWAVMEMDKP